MKKSELKERKHSLEFFYGHIEISKLSLLQKLNQENSNKRALMKIKSTNEKLIKTVGKKWLNRYIDYYVADKKLPKFYILVEPSSGDKIAEIGMKRLEEFVKNEIVSDSFVVTVGQRTSEMVSKYNLRVVENFETNDLDKDTSKFSEKISSLIEVGINNNVFGYVEIIVAEINSRTKELVRQKLFPFGEAGDLDKATKDLNQKVDQDGINVEPEIENESLEIKKAREYIEIMEAIDLTKNKWSPDIANFYALFAKSMMKSSIYELQIIRRIESLTLELALLNDKQNKIEEQLSDVTKAFNRIRKEETTLQGLILHAAFENRKKKKADDESIYNKYRSFARDLAKGGN
ncbi:hypothetical protein EI74_0367 [Mycoplasma testudineum]|uniref:Uncharacterized protein n=1 Tax=Mycoplasma testudineum TaxID=244584 RepID=A0A4R6IFN2_9MOLU|nr:hypothetical protein [Mycoplasma testudineum]OYD26985.1 hypothetical protein CG473_01460 [Mycoplasma testudineum]TDO20531.1 hypothetical protein EI74_0367 [Mycoplasma testudineum]